MPYDDEHCVVFGKIREYGERGRHHACDPTPPISQNWAARLTQGFRLLNSN